MLNHNLPCQQLSVAEYLHYHTENTDYSIVVYNSEQWKYHMYLIDSCTVRDSYSYDKTEFDITFTV